MFSSFFRSPLTLNILISLLIFWSVWMLFRAVRFFFLDFSDIKKILYTRLKTIQKKFGKPGEKNPYLEQKEPLFFLKILKKNGYLKRLQKDFFLVSPEKSFFQFLLFTSLFEVLCFLSSLFLLGSLWKSSAALTLLLSFIFGIIHLKALKIRSKLTAQLPDTLDAISNAIHAGYSFPQALEFVERESLPPTQYLLNTAVKELHYNFGIEDVLNNLQKKAKNKDVSLVMEGLIMQLKIGGNLREMMKKESHIIRERLSLEKDIKAATSQGRLSGIIVASLWPISILLFYIISPEYITIMFTSTIGQTLLFLAIILEIFGFLLIWKITYVKL